MRSYVQIRNNFRGMLVGVPGATYALTMMACFSLVQSPISATVA